MRSASRLASRGLGSRLLRPASPSDSSSSTRLRARRVGRGPAVQVGDLFAAQVLPYFDQYALSHRFWSPDSRSIALPLADADGTVGIVSIPADGRATTRVADGVAASWSP